MISTQIYSQELTQLQIDSLYTKFLQLRAPELLPQTDKPVELTLEDRKCGFDLANQIKLNFNFFSQEQQNILKSLVERHPLPNSIVSPKQNFRIHYTNTGSDAVSYDVNLLAQALDSSYSFEIDYLGYPPPPPDGSAGGDDKYDVYVLNLGNLYGQTASENNVGTSRWTSYIEIDNDFPWYSNAIPPKLPIDAARVTVAHEFHHSIQLGNYAPESGGSYRASDIYFHELTSTSMEEFVFDHVDDYYDYMNTYFNKSYNAFPSYTGYDLALWNIYLVENFEFEIIRDQWERMPTQRALFAISNTLVFRGTSFAREYNKFGIWSYFTNFRTVPGLYFEEALYYPIVRPLVTISYPQYTYANVEAYATSNNFVKFGITTNGDTLYAIVTNGDITSAVNEPGQTYNFTYTLFSDTISGSRKLTDNYSSDFSSGISSVWSISEILNNVVVLADTVENQIPEDLNYAYPNPFNYKSNFLSTPLIFFPFDSELGEEVDFNVYSIEMEVVFSKPMNIQILPGDQRGVAWDVIDDGEKLASGIYIYVIKNGDEVVKGKVVIFNE
jgi:hypothetical protein